MFVWLRVPNFGVSQDGNPYLNAEVKAIKLLAVDFLNTLVFPNSQRAIGIYQ